MVITVPTIDTIMMNQTSKAVLPLPFLLALKALLSFFMFFFMFPCKRGVDKGDESIVGVATGSDVFDSGQI